MPKASHEAKRKFNQRNRLLYKALTLKDTCFKRHLLQETRVPRTTYFSERTFTFAGILISVHLGFGSLLSRNIRFFASIHIECDLFHLAIGKWEII